MNADPGGEPPDEVARPGSAIVRIMLGAQLRRFREAADVSRDTAAFRIRASNAKISRMENGRTGFKKRDLTDLLELYGVTDLQGVDGILELATHANAQAWWAKYGDSLPGWFEPYLGLEASASLIRAFDLQFVNGLFQTEEYARAVIRLGARTAPVAEVSRRVTVRLRRQELLTRQAPPRIWCVIDEAALRRPVGGTRVMRQQIRRLAEAAALHNVTLQVIPFAVGAHDAAGGPFTILRFAESDVPDIVYTEQLSGAQYLEREQETDRYMDIMNRLSASALTPRSTISFLTRFINEI